MSKKNDVKAYLVISPYSSNRFGRENVFLGGCASSAASEVANEEGGFIVELNGSFDQDQIVKMYEEQVEFLKDRITYETDPDVSRFNTYPQNPQIQSKYVAELSTFLLYAEKNLEKAKKEYKEKYEDKE